MEEAYSQKPINYCFQCGKRVGQAAESCWFCGISVRRQIRAPRRCPYCAEPMRPEAVKCRHCGEFLDGRPREDTRPTHQVIIIDKDLLHTMRDLQLAPGAPIPDEARRVLEARTIRAIEADAPEQIDQPGVRVLPAPEDDRPPLEDKRAGSTALSKWSGQERPRDALARPIDGGRPEPLARRDERADALARREEKRYLPAKGGKHGVTSDILDADFADEYRICSKCGTENLRQDNYCYYCGTQHRRTQADRYRDRAARRQVVRNAAKFVLALVLLGLIGLAAFLYFSGRLSLDEFRALRGKVAEEAREKLEEGKALAGVGADAAEAAATCRSNLGRLDAAKRAVVERQGLATGEAPLSDILRELKADALPKCPSGGTYTIGEVGRPPACSIGKNSPITIKDDHVIGE